MQGDGHIAGQGPDRRGPDHDEELAAVQMGELAQVVAHGEFDVDRGDRIVLVLDLSFRQGGFVLRAPVDGLEALVDITLAVHPAEDLDLLGLEGLVHGQVGMLPVGHDAKPFKALALTVHEVAGEVLAGGAEGRDGHGLVVELVLLDDGGLDGHTVVIPAGNVGRIVAAHGLGADDEVLEGLVQRVTHVDIAVGERRAVMQDELGLSGILFAQLGIDVDLVPGFQHARLTHRQSAAHGEIGLWGDDGGFVVHGLYSFVGRIFFINIGGSLRLLKRQREPPLRYHSYCHTEVWPLVHGVTPMKRPGLRRQKPFGGVLGDDPRGGLPLPYTDRQLSARARAPHVPFKAGNLFSCGSSCRTGDRQTSPRCRG